MADGVALATPPAAERQPVFDFDFYAEDHYDGDGQFHRSLARMNEAAPPVFWSPAQGGHWVIQGRELVHLAARETDLFSSRAMNIPASDRDFMTAPAIPIMLDPPAHPRYRKPLAELFGPGRMLRMEGAIRDFAIRLIEAVKADGRCDLVEAVCEPLPVLTFLDLLGFDTSRVREFRDLAVRGSVDPDPDVRMRCSTRIAEITSDFIDARLAQPRGEPRDMTDELLRLEIDGRPITPDEAKAYMRLLFFAGLDTVVNVMGFGTMHLARDPAAQARMRDRPGDIRNAVEELLRLSGPVQPGRYVTRDALWHGVQLRQGDRALLCLPSANHDAGIFADPLHFDPDRPTIAHMTFNAGPHRCVGQHLARVELRVMFEEWLKRVPPFRLDPDRPPRGHGGMVMGLESLPLVWDAA